MTKRKRVSYRDILYKEEKNMRIEKEKQWMYETAKHEGLDPNDENFTEKLSWGKTWEEAYEEFENKIEGDWILKKTKKGDIFIKIKEITSHKPKDKKKRKRYEYGYVQITVPSEWIGYTAMVVLSKTKTPKMKFYTSELQPEDLLYKDPSEIGELVFEPKKSEREVESPKKENPSLSESEFWDKVTKG